MDMLEERTKYYIEVATQEPTIINRLSGVGVVSKEDALRLGAVGPDRPRFRYRPRRAGKTILTPLTVNWISTSSPTTTATFTAGLSSG